MNDTAGAIRQGPSWEVVDWIYSRQAWYCQIWTRNGLVGREMWGKGPGLGYCHSSSCVCVHLAHACICSIFGTYLNCHVESDIWPALSVFLQHLLYAFYSKISVQYMIINLALWSAPCMLGKRMADVSKKNKKRKAIILNNLLVGGGVELTQTQVSAVVEAVNIRKWKSIHFEIIWSCFLIISHRTSYEIHCAFCYLVF